MINKWLPVLMFALLLFSCKEKKNAPEIENARKQKTVLQVEAIIIKPQSIEDEVQISGSLISSEEVELRPEISGRITGFYIDEGKAVKKGDLLVKLYDEDLQAQLKKLKIQLQINQKTFERQQELLKIQGISQQEVDLTGLQVSNIKADIDIISTNISKTEIRAPFSGRLGLKRISPGAYITPASVITTLSQVNPLKIEFNVPEKYSSQIKLGQAVNFSIEGNNKTYIASIAATESMIEETTRSLKVRALIKNNDNFLVPGAFAKINLILDKKSNALLIPTDAVIPQARTKQAVLYNGGVAVFKNITTGVRKENFIEVLDGIKPGDTIITTGMMFLKPKMDVKLTKVQ